MAGISTLTVQQYFQTFFESRKKTVLVWGIWGIYFLWQIVSMQEISEFPVWLRLGISIIFVIIAAFNVDGSLFGKAVFAIIYNVIWMLTESLTGYFFMMIDMDYASQELVGSMVSKLLLLMLVKILQKFFYYEGVRKLSWKYNVMFMLIPAGSLFVSYHLFIVSSKINERGYVFFSFFSALIIFAVNIIFFILYIRLAEDAELRRKNSMFKLEIDMYNEHIKEKESTMLEFRKARHDLKHQMIYLLEVLENREYEKLENYLKKLVNWEPLEGLTIANTENSMIDALVNYKYGIAKKHGISFTIKLEVPTSLPFEGADLCIILGNALDNAIEAGLRGEVSEPYINLKIKYDGGNLIMILENSFDGKIRKNYNGKILTRKQDMKNHGIGIDSMKKAVEKYHGYFDIKSDNHIFCLKIILYSD